MEPGDRGGEEPGAGRNGGIMPCSALIKEEFERVFMGMAAKDEKGLNPFYHKKKKDKGYYGLQLRCRWMDRHQALIGGRMGKESVIYIYI